MSGHTLSLNVCPGCGAERELWDAKEPRRCRRCYWDSMKKTPEEKTRTKRLNGRNLYWRDPEKQTTEASLDFALNKEARLAAQRERYHKDPQKFRARAAVAQALKRGALTKKPCACGAPSAHAHHDNYLLPLDVRWLCTACHGREHRKD